jgi:transcriptional regulator with XRE-family HTH domain
MVFGAGAKPDQRAAETQVDDEMLALVTQLTNAINWHMRESGLTRADLATRMGVSPGRVSQILGGGENLTLRTLAALSTALDARFEIELSALKSGDSYTSHGAADAGRAGRHRPLSRAAHREARLDPAADRRSL